MKTLLLAAAALVIATGAHAAPSCQEIATWAHSPEAASAAATANKSVGELLDEDYRVWHAHGRSMFDWATCGAPVAHKAPAPKPDPEDAAYTQHLLHPDRQWNEIINGHSRHCMQWDFPKSGVVRTECNPD